MTTILNKMRISLRVCVYVFLFVRLLACLVLFMLTLSIMRLDALVLPSLEVSILDVERGGE